MLIMLVLVPLLIGLYFRLQRRRRLAAASLGSLGQVQSSTGSALGRRRHIPPAFFLLGLTFLLFGLARPEMVVDLPHVEGTVILAFDISNSMIADDLEPTRIDAAKVAARAFVENQPQTIKIGVVAFSNGGLVVQQPTNDQAAVLAAIDRLKPQGGTVLGQGIFTSLNAIAGEALSIDAESLETLDLEEYSSAVVLLLTDGEDTGGQDPLEIAQVAAEAGVRIYPIGIGTTEGTVMELEGFNILTQLNEPALQEIASLTNGSYYQAQDAETLQEVYQDVDLQLTVEGEKSEITSIVTGISLLFLLMGGALSLRWFGRAP